MENTFIVIWFLSDINKNVYLKENYSHYTLQQTLGYYNNLFIYCIINNLLKYIIYSK